MNFIYQTLHYLDRKNENLFYFFHLFLTNLTLRDVTPCGYVWNESLTQLKCLLTPKTRISNYKSTTCVYFKILFFNVKTSVWSFVRCQFKDTLSSKSDGL